MFIDSYSLSCGLGETVNSACSECIVISICLQDNPCENGEKCVQDPAVISQYTCNCSGTGYTGKNCTNGKHACMYKQFVTILLGN